MLEATLADRVRLTAERDGLQISNDAYATTNRQLVANLESERSLGMAETHQLRAEAEKRATELAETHAALKGARNCVLDCWSRHSGVRWPARARVA